MMTHGLAEKLSLHGKTITNRKRVQADCNMEGMSIQGAVRSDVVHAYQSSVLSSVPATIVVLPQISLARRLGGAQGRRPEPTMTNWGNARKTCAIIPHGPARHSRAQLTRASCLLPRVLALYRFPAQHGNNSSAADDHT